MHEPAGSAVGLFFLRPLTLAAAAFAVVLLLVCAGCANRRAVLYEGVHFGALQTLTPISDTDAQRVARQSEASWRRELEGRARNDPGERFDNLAPLELRRRLVELGGKYGFSVVAVKLLRPRQLAPEVIVYTTHYVALARGWRRGRAMGAKRSAVPIRARAVERCRCAAGASSSLNPAPSESASFRSARQRGQTFARRCLVSSRCSGRTLVSASTGMKFVSPAQRGTTCRWTWSTIPAPAMRPRFQPTL
jgi:hypothetical protein